jgi:hypothetical protein
MKALRLLLLVWCLIVLHATGTLAQDRGRIYGRITTEDGETLEGLIRWDKNEASWVDILNGSKEIPREYLRAAREKSRLRDWDRDRNDSVFELLGISFGRRRSERNWSSTAVSGIRFGHIKSLEPAGRDRARLVLKSGQEIELMHGSTDIGTDLRGVMIEDNRRGEVELKWRDLRRVEFMATKPGTKSRFGDRLYGTLTTRRGDELTGFVTWDMDEIFPTDVLDGDERGRRRKIEFDKIASIKRYGSRGAEIRLKSGEEMILRGTNDVNDGNRGIVIADPGFGQVKVGWRELEKLEFKQTRSEVSYNDFDGGRRLKGTVHTKDGKEYRGAIRWDNDEEYTWELLDGKYHDMELDIELGSIRSIEKQSFASSKITLLDGRTFELRDSNDVDEGNKGIFIALDDGEEVLVEWRDFRRVDLWRK